MIQQMPQTAIPYQAPERLPKTGLLLKRRVPMLCLVQTLPLAKMLRRRFRTLRLIRMPGGRFRTLAQQRLPQIGLCGTSLALNRFSFFGSRQ
jgi:hypothetical protein